MNWTWLYRIFGGPGLISFRLRIEFFVDSFIVRKDGQHPFHSFGK